MSLFTVLKYSDICLGNASELMNLPNDLLSLYFYQVLPDRKLNDLYTIDSWFIGYILAWGYYTTDKKKMYEDIFKKTLLEYEE